jgi:enoyl-CoA hydratase
MKTLGVKRHGAVAICTFTNPPEGFMDATMTAELNALTEELESDPDVRAVVFTGGVEGVFIRHYSVRELEALSVQLRERGVKVDAERRVPERETDRIFRRIETMPKPVIAAINGMTMGGGFEFSLACDIRIAAQGDYSIGLPEINIGILPGAGGTQKLGRLIGTGRALEMILRGRTVGPEEALRLGMVHEVVPAEEVVDRAIAVAEEIASKSPVAVAHIKRLVRSATETPLDEGLSLERTLFLDLLVSDDGFRLMHAMNEGNRDIRDV